jgi:hypothetical protein
VIQIFNYARAGGKTTALVKMAIDQHMDIMVFDQREKRRLLEKYSDLNRTQVFTLEEAQSRKGIREYNGTVIDNLDIILAYLLPTDVHAISLTDPVMVMQSTKESKK